MFVVQYFDLNTEHKFLLVCIGDFCWELRVSYVTYIDILLLIS